ncbi:hypothetical protein SLEP1_g27651 [Rubroshorea leprosula]|uniref:Uncharacterized protein n=1 Tax=Rubroshorea leprosula TaxID=152421 RepID=A0AAV5K0D9_9ROSI|nr:hypothetical protein SLEP1_g27651 [Rubroshorea leprosula]
MPSSSTSILFFLLSPTKVKVLLLGIISKLYYFANYCS